MAEKLIEQNWIDYRSDLDNLNVENWVWKQTETLLNEQSITDSFYTKEANEVKYNMTSVKDYLTKIAYKEWSTTDLKSWNEFLALFWGRTTAWTMAIQIALESLWNPRYGLGQIDWKYWPKTKTAIRNFQEDNWFTWKDTDGRAWPKTIQKILEKLDVLPPTPTYTAKAWVEVTKWDTPDPKDFVDGLVGDETAVVFVGTPDFNTVGAWKTVDVKITDKAGNDTTVTCTYEVKSA